MRQSKKEEQNLREPEKQEHDPGTISDEEFEKQQKKENAIIELILDGILTFFQTFF